MTNFLWLSFEDWSLSRVGVAIVTAGMCWELNSPSDYSAQVFH